MMDFSTQSSFFHLRSWGVFHHLDLSYDFYIWEPAAATAAADFDSPASLHVT